MFDLYAGSQAETVDKDKSTLTGEKLNLTLHASSLAAVQKSQFGGSCSPLFVLISFTIAVV